MRKVFWENPYLCELDTTVTAVCGPYVSFAETIIFAESGGQESDVATVNGRPVRQAILTDDKLSIRYLFDDGHCFAVGDKVRMNIDWQRRNKLMCLHFACELVLVLVNRHFGAKPAGQMLTPDEIDQIGPFKTGAHMSAERARVDFQCRELKACLPTISEQFDAIIHAALPIETGYLNQEGQERYWRLADFATVPCGGTHVRNTQEIGAVNLRVKNVGNYQRDPQRPIRRIEISLQNTAVTAEPCLLGSLKALY